MGTPLQTGWARTQSSPPTLPTAPAEGCPRGESQHQLLIIIAQQPDAETELQVRVDEAGIPHLCPVPIHSLQGLSWLWHLWESCKPWFAFSWPVAMWILKAPPPNRGYCSLSTLLAFTEHSASKVRVSHHLYSWPQHLDSHLAWGETQKICKMNSSEKPPEVRKKKISDFVLGNHSFKETGICWVSLHNSSGIQVLLKIIQAVRNNWSLPAVSTQGQGQSHAIPTFLREWRGNTDAKVWAAAAPEA